LNGGIDTSEHDDRDGSGNDIVVDQTDQGTYVLFLTSRGLKRYFTDFLCTCRPAAIPSDSSSSRQAADAPRPLREGLVFCGELGRPRTTSPLVVARPDRAIQYSVSRIDAPAWSGA
jgi:hypothetical protein